MVWGEGRRSYYLPVTLWLGYGDGGCEGSWRGSCLLPVTLELGYWEGEMGGLFFTCRSRVSVRVGGGGVVSYLLLEGHDCVNSDCTLLTRVCDPNGARQKETRRQ